MGPNITENEVKEMISIELREKLKEVMRDVVEHFDNLMNDTMSEMLHKLDKKASKESRDLADSETFCNRTKRTEENALPAKQFLQRNSLLTDLYEVKHIRTIYNFSISTLIILLIHTAVYDIRNTGLPILSINTIRRGFGKFPVVLYVWPLMKCSALGVYVAFCYWATRRLEFPPKLFIRRIWDYAWLGGFAAFLILLLILPTKVVIDENLPVASSLIILMEQVRLVMKTHAFVRSVAPKVLSFKPHSEMPAVVLPDFSKFLYFMFVPTLIYQDSYPRLKKTRWNMVLINFTEVLAIIFFVAILYERMLYPTFRNYGTEPIEWGMLTLNILSSVVPGMLLFVCGFYLLLHCWMNAFAEVLRFADKMFYKDWWNSNGYSAYYRNWNIVVHDWLYTYVYKDMYEILTPGDKTASICAVFAISAIVHEYILSFAFGFFYPVMLLLFGGIGLSVMFLLKKTGNVFVWFTLCIGCGTLASLYCMEYFARINCPATRDDFIDYLIPRSWTCAYNSKTVEQSVADS